MGAGWGTETQALTWQTDRAISPPPPHHEGWALASLRRAVGAPLSAGRVKETQRLYRFPRIPEAAGVLAAHGLGGYHGRWQRELQLKSQLHIRER